MLEPLPDDLCPIPPKMREHRTPKHPAILAAKDPILLEHRDRMFRQHLGRRNSNRAFSNRALNGDSSVRQSAGRGKMRGIKGKRFIVAGGAAGIGEALVARLVAEGANVVVGDVNEAALKSSISRLPMSKGKVIGVPFDLADEQSIKSLVERSIGELGGIDGLASTAADLSAATMGKDIDVLTMEAKIWERTNQVNLLGHGLLMREVIPHLVARGGAHLSSRHLPQLLLAGPIIQLTLPRRRTAGHRAQCGAPVR